MPQLHTENRKVCLSSPPELTLERAQHACSPVSAGSSSSWSSVASSSRPELPFLCRGAASTSPATPATASPLAALSAAADVVWRPPWAYPPCSAIESCCCADVDARERARRCPAPWCPPGRRESMRRAWQCPDSHRCQRCGAGGLVRRWGAAVFGSCAGVSSLAHAPTTTSPSASRRDASGAAIGDPAPKKCPPIVDRLRWDPGTARSLRLRHPLRNCFVGDRPFESWDSACPKKAQEHWAKRKTQFIFQRACLIA